MDSNPQRVMRCAGAHYHCRPNRCVDSNHRRVIRCAGAHHHPRPPPRERSVCQDACVSQHTLPAGAQHSGRRETRVRRRYVTDSYGWCADAHHHLRPRRCLESNPQRVMRCAGAHHHCRLRRRVDSNLRRVIRCAGAHHHPRPCRCMDSNHRLDIRCAGAHQRFRPRRCMNSYQRLCS